MCSEAGIAELKTNNSLRISGATSICCSGGVPERGIQRRTGHRSVDALRKYEGTGKQQHQVVSNMLASSVDLPYSHHLASVSSHCVLSHTLTKLPTGVNLPSVFSARSGTLNIAPQGNFVVNIHCGEVRSEFDEFDALFKDANF